MAVQNLAWLSCYKQPHREVLSLPTDRTNPLTAALISVVIPTLNEGQKLVAAVETLMGQQDVGEIVIVDASDDTESLQTLDQLGGWKQLRILQAERRGRAVQMNQGAASCQFAALLFLHCDTVPPPGAATLVQQALLKHRWGRFDLKLDAPGFRFRLIETMIMLRSRLTRIATGDQGIFVERQFFKQQGGFADIALMEDIEFSRRVGKHCQPALVKQAAVTSARRWRNHGTLRTVLLMWKLRLQYRMGVSPDRLAAMYRDAR